MINIDQSPIGRTPRSNPATYVGLFAPVRELFSLVPEARMRGATSPAASRSTSRAGRCEACEGDGVLKIEMHFLPDVYVTCDVCGGQALQPRDAGDPLQGKQHRRGARHDRAPGPRFLRGRAGGAEKAADTLYDVGLGYLRLGQAATTLSGRRGAADQAVQGAVAPGDRPHRLPAGRADDRAALRRHQEAAVGC